MESIKYATNPHEKERKKNKEKREKKGEGFKSMSTTTVPTLGKWEK